MRAPIILKATIYFLGFNNLLFLIYFPKLSLKVTKASTEILSDADKVRGGPIVDTMEAKIARAQQRKYEAVKFYRLLIYPSLP